MDLVLSSGSSATRANGAGQKAEGLRRGSEQDHPSAVYRYVDLLFLLLHQLKPKTSLSRNHRIYFFRCGNPSVGHHIRRHQFTLQLTTAHP